MPQNSENNEFLKSVENLRKLFTITPSEEPLTIKKNLEEHKDKIIQILTNEESYNLIAPMSSGKTTTLLKVADEKNVKTIMLLPLVSLVMQKNKDFRENFGIVLGPVHGGDSKNKIAAVSDNQIKQFLLREQIIVSVYDSLPRVVDMIIRENNDEAALKEYTLIIDESHNLVTQSDFRIKAIYEISQLMEKFKKTIYLTGTPECTILNEYKTIRFEYDNVPINYQMKLVEYSSQGIHKLINHLKSKRIKGKVVIVYDNIKELGLLKSLIVKYLEIDEKNISIISSQDKNDDTFITLVEEETIPNDVQYLLTTRVISDGINIFNLDVECLYLINLRDYWLKRQFIARFRNGVKYIYDFVEANTFHPFTISDYKAEWQRIENIRLENLALIQTVYNRKLPWMEKLYQIRLSSPLRLERDRVIYLDDRSGKYKLIPQKIALIILDEINKTLKSNMRLASWFYTEICKYEVLGIHNYIELYESGNFKEIVSENEFKKEKLKYEMTVDPDNYEDIKSHFDRILAAIINHYGKEKYFDKYNRSALIETIYDKNELEVFYSKNKVLFNRYEQTLKYILKMLIENYPTKIIEYSLYLGCNKGVQKVNELIGRLSNFADLMIILNCPTIREAPYIYNEVFSNIKMVNVIERNINVGEIMGYRDIDLYREKLIKDGIVKDIKIQPFHTLVKTLFQCHIERIQNKNNLNKKRDTFYFIQGYNTIELLMNDIEDIPNEIRDVIIANWGRIYLSRLRYYLKQFIENVEEKHYQEYAKDLLNGLEVPYEKIC